VVENAKQLQVILRDQGKTYDARVVGTSPLDDIAVIKIDAQDLPTIAFGDSHAIKVGQLAIAIGSPLGQSNSVTKGVISALHRSLQVPDPANPGATEDILNAIQTDASINPGNSGGPLLNSGGQVVGVNFAIEQAQSGPGLGFALDGDAARDIANQLIQTGHVNQPFLGVSYQQLDETAAAASALVVRRHALAQVILAVEIRFTYLSCLRYRVKIHWLLVTEEPGNGILDPSTLVLFTTLCMSRNSRRIPLPGPLTHALPPDRVVDTVPIPHHCTRVRTCWSKLRHDLV